MASQVPGILPTCARYFGEASPPLELRWIENRPVVTRIFDKEAAASAAIAVGDTMSALTARMLVREPPSCRAIFPRRRPKLKCGWKACAKLLAGAEGSEAAVQFRKPDGNLHTAILARKSAYRNEARASAEDALRLLPGNIGFADLIGLSVPMVNRMFEKFRNTDAIIFDMRGYPQGTAWAIAPRLSAIRSPVGALFSRPIAMAPDPGPGEPAENTTFSLRSRSRPRINRSTRAKP